MTDAATATSAPPKSKIVGGRRVGDSFFLGLSTTAAVSIMLILAGVAIFLILKGLPAITANWSEGDLAGYQNKDWGSFWEYVGPLLWGSIWAAFIAMILGTPVAIGIAMFISHYAPRRIAGFLGYIIDLLAAVPSVVFGLWGIKVLAPAITPLYAWLNANLGWLPFFAGTPSSTGRTILTVAIVLAVMIIPIITALSREVFLQTPRLHEEAALALGATRWEMITMAVLPFGRPGVISASMLGLGRALGETMVVAMILSPGWLITFVLTSSENMPTIAGNIALQFPEAAGLNVNALIATGLVLFVITFAVNAMARWIISRRAAFSGAN